MSKTVMLEREGVLDQIRRETAESEIPVEECAVLCSMRLFQWIVERVGVPSPGNMRKQLGADLLIGVGYLEDRKVIVTDRETARKITSSSVQA